MLADTLDPAARADIAALALMADAKDEAAQLFTNTMVSSTFPFLI